jgi:hypothetical protein
MLIINNINGLIDFGNGESESERINAHGRRGPGEKIGRLGSSGVVHRGAYQLKE